jgi:nicotinate-nucleotide pyrophosphorylase
VRWRRSSEPEDGSPVAADEPGQPSATAEELFGTPGLPEGGDGGQAARSDDAAALHVPVELGVVGQDDLARATRRAVSRALAEDLGDGGDVTSLATIAPGTTGTARLVARGGGVLCGLGAVRETFEQLDPRVTLELDRADGDFIAPGDVIGTVTGPLRSILTGERTALNFLCHLSGVATRTREFVDAVAGTPARVRDTRKTTPGMRLLEKHAVAVGGGANHRVGLHDAVLVKDNHIAAAGGLAEALAAVRKRVRPTMHVQVEVADLDQLEVALEEGVTDILLDNFTPEQVRQALHRVGDRAALEVSGGLTLDTVAAYAATGVGRLAIGAITHSAPIVDIALDVTAQELEQPSWATALTSVWDADARPQPEPEPEPEQERGAEDEVAAEAAAEFADLDAALLAEGMAAMDADEVADALAKALDEVERVQQAPTAEPDAEPQPAVEGRSMPWRDRRFSQSPGQD